MQIHDETSRFQQIAKRELFFRSNPCKKLYIVRSGHSSSALRHSDDHEIIVNVVRSGRFVRKLGILTRKSRSKSAIDQSSSGLRTSLPDPPAEPAPL